MSLGIIASVAGGALGLLGSKSAGKAQAQAARDAAAAQVESTEKNIEFQQGIYDDTVARFDPFYTSGLDAQNALYYELFGGPAPMLGQTSTPLAVEAFTEFKPGTEPERIAAPGLEQFGPFGFMGKPHYSSAIPDQRTTRYRVGDQVFETLDEANAWAEQNATLSGGYEYGGYQKTPGYDFRLNEGMNALQSSVAAQQGMNSGAAMKALTRYGQDYATNEYNNYLNRLAGAASQGQAAAGAQAGAGQFLGGQVGNAYQTQGNALAQGFLNAGNAQAAGIMGGVNSITNGISNALGAWQFNQLLPSLSS